MSRWQANANSDSAERKIIVGKKVLIVDDDLQTLELVGLMLEREGHTIIAQRTGLKAIKAAQEYLPDIILLDIMMPGIDGYDVLKKLKQDPKTSDIPVIIFSARSQSEEQIKFMDAGAIDYVSKPAKTGELVHAVEVTLSAFGK